MRLEQTIRSTMTEAMDMDGRLDQLVRAGLMPTSSLPLLKRAISRMHAGMSLQGAERDVMNMFISSMMFIVLGDDTVFNKARAGAKGYATEETEDDGWYTHSQMHGSKKSEKHPKGISAAEWKSGIRWHHAKNKRINIKEAKEKTEYDYEGDMAMGQLKSIIANSQRMHDMLSEDTNLPEWVQSKITLAEDYITTASNYMQGEMNESKDGMPFEGPYRKVGERKDEYGNKVKNVAKYLAKKAMNKQKNEDVEQIDEYGIDQNAHSVSTGYTPKTPPKTKPIARPTMHSAAEKPRKPQSSVGTLARVRSGMAKRLNNANVKEDIDAVKKMNESYKIAFETALNEYGIKSPSELDESKRKEFFNHVDLEFKKGDN